MLSILKPNFRKVGNSVPIWWFPPVPSCETFRIFRTKYMQLPTCSHNHPFFVFTTVTNNGFPVSFVIEWESNDILNKKVSYYIANFCGKTSTMYREKFSHIIIIPYSVDIYFFLLIIWDGWFTFVAQETLKISLLLICDLYSRSFNRICDEGVDRFHSRCHTSLPPCIIKGSKRLLKWLHVTTVLARSFFCQHATRARSFQYNF